MSKKPKGKDDLVMGPPSMAGDLIAERDRLREEVKNPHAQALGRMGRGIKKTMSAKAMAARKRASKFPRPSRRKENQSK